MLRDEYLRFILVVVGLHVALFFAGFIFLGLDYSLVIAVIWAAIWITYCGIRKKKGTDEEYSAVSIPAMALIGGPFSWILYPLCLSPRQQREATGSAYLWFAVQRIAGALKDAVTNILDHIYSYCEKDHPAKD